jgi:hypothetical protein
MSNRDDAIKNAVSSFAKLFGESVKDVFDGKITLSEAIDRMPIQKLDSVTDTDTETINDNHNVKPTTTEEVKKTL